MVSLFAGLIGDLEHARRASLLIEIQRKHIEEIVKEHPTFELKNYCDNIFNKGLPQLKTNVVVIDASNKEKAQLLHAFIGLIEDSLKRKKEIDSALNLGLHFATLGLSEFIDGSITDNVANYIDETWDVVQESVSHFLGKKVEDKIVGKAEEGTEQLINSTTVYYQPGTTLYLSKKAKAKLTSLTNKLIKKHSPSEAMQFLVELVATLGDDAPKLLVINDPFSLDAESLSFCSLLLSYAKDLKQQGQVVPVSVVFNYTSKQPYDNESKEEKNFQPLQRLRHMMQRYDMLEKPDSNIPSPAIKSSTFVGRQEELAQLMRQHDELLAASLKNEDKRICQWTLIKGEPGTGKTALINRHLDELEKLSDDASKSQIRLRLLNQVGHSSQVTGLASLLQSIHAEASRLSQCYKESNGPLNYYIKETINKYTKSAQDFVSLSEHVRRKKKFTTEEVRKAFKVIASITNKDKLYASVEAMYDRTKIKESTTQSAEAFTEGSTQNKKQEAFDNLSNALRHLCSIANAVSPVNKKMPLILVIDDLQWVDELSAEYVLEHLVGNYSIELLITSRDSDSQASYKLALAKSKYLPYTIKLFDKANSLVTGSISTLENKSKKPIEAVTEPILLEGMDRLTVINLLKATYEIPKGLDIDIFGVIADSLIKSLSGNESDENEQVNTLFVIETLNLLSDPAFYRRHSALSPLFSLNNKDKYCLTVDSAEAFKVEIKEAFNLLESTHKAAYEHESAGPRNHYRFCLASYSVLEERLLVIHQYFGNKLLFSLYISSLLGEPFDSEIVKNVALEFDEIDLEEFEELEPLKVYLSGDSQQGFCLEHIEILEEVFAILCRLYPSPNQLRYRHMLFSTFIRQQLPFFLRSVGLELNSNVALESFFLTCIQRVEKEASTITGKDSLKNLLTISSSFSGDFWRLPYTEYLLDRLGRIDSEEFEGELEASYIFSDIEDILLASVYDSEISLKNVLAYAYDMFFNIYNHLGVSDDKYLVINFEDSIFKFVSLTKLLSVYDENSATEFEDKLLSFIHSRELKVDDNEADRLLLDAMSNGLEFTYQNYCDGYHLDFLHSMKKFIEFDQCAVSLESTYEDEIQNPRSLLSSQIYVDMLFCLRVKWLAYVLDRNDKGKASMLSIKLKEIMHDSTFTYELKRDEFSKLRSYLVM